MSKTDHITNIRYPYAKTWDKHNYYVEFELGNIQTSMANGIRRTIISDIKTVGFRTEPYEASQVKVIVNDTPLHNQFVLHRISLIPIHIAKPDTFDVDDYLFSIDVVNGTIVDINILNGGNNYTTATITLNDPLQQAIGNTANLQAVISPQYGHGFDPQRELGGSSVMVSVDIEGDADGNLPVRNNGTDSIRQMCLVKDLKVTTGAFGTASYYPMYTTITTSNPPVNFTFNEIVYVGSSFSTATFSARVVHFDDTINTLYVNNIVGDVNNIENETIYQKDAPSAFA